MSSVLALDFDGVVCHSLDEVFATALATYEALVPDSPLIAGVRSRIGDGDWHRIDLSNEPVLASFESLMPFGNRAEDFGVSLRAAERGLLPTDQAAYDAYRAAIEPEWIERFHVEFYRRRNAARAADLYGWLALHRPYEPFLELLRRRASSTTLALATAKDADSATVLLEHLGVGDLFRPELILDKEAGVGKTAHLSELRRRLGVDFEEITFVDDKVNHLEAVADLCVRPVLAAWGFNTPREHALARAHGFAVANLDDAESILFAGG